MSRIALAVGFPDTKSETEPQLIYLGRSGAEMRKAMDSAPHQRMIVVPFLEGIPKNNPRATANAAKLAATRSAAEAAVARAGDEAAAQIADLQRLLTLAEDAYTALNHRFAALELEVSALTAKLTAAAAAPATQSVSTGAGQAVEVVADGAAVKPPETASCTAPALESPKKPRR